VDYVCCYTTCFDFELNCNMWLTSLQHGKYVWKTYKEVYDLVIKVGNAMRSCGFAEVSLLAFISAILPFAQYFV
jgi:hypothetical protein